MTKFVEKMGAYVTDGTVWHDDSIVVIGRELFDQEFLTNSVQFSGEMGFRCAYMSQEAFVDLMEYGKPPMYFNGDPRIRDHPGLCFLATIGFAWPRVKEHLSTATYDQISHYPWNDYAAGWQEAHPIRSIFRYSVQKGITEIERHNALRSAIRKDALGLRVVAEHIAWLVNRPQNVNMADAVERWKQDLDWLYENFYKNTIYSFVWPQV